MAQTVVRMIRASVCLRGGAATQPDKSIAAPDPWKHQSVRIGYCNCLRQRLSHTGRRSSRETSRCDTARSAALPPQRPG